MTYDIRAFSCKNSFGYSVTIFLLIFMFVVMLVSQLSVYYLLHLQQCLEVSTFVASFVNHSNTFFSECILLFTLFSLLIQLFLVVHT